LTDISLKRIFLPVKPSNRLRVLRADKRKSQLETALGAKIPEGRYWRIENGYIEPSSDERAAIAKSLGVSEAEAFPEVTA
jgi:transcriptional regulator with XRE-family HTH domain